MSEDADEEGRRTAEQSQGLECDTAAPAEAEWVRHTLQTTVEVEGMFGRLEWRVERVCKPTASRLRALPIVLAVNLLCICVLAAGWQQRIHSCTPVVAVGETDRVSGHVRSNDN